MGLSGFNNARRLAEKKALEFLKKEKEAIEKEALVKADTEENKEEVSKKKAKSKSKK